MNDILIVIGVAAFTLVAIKLIFMAAHRDSDTANSTDRNNEAESKILRRISEDKKSKKEPDWDDGEV